jgi:hypothetical protein
MMVRPSVPKARFNGIDAKIDAIGRKFDRLAFFARAVDQIGHHVRLEGGITFVTPGTPPPTPAFWEQCKREYPATLAFRGDEWPKITLDEEALDFSAREA